MSGPAKATAKSDAGRSAATLDAVVARPFSASTLRLGREGDAFERAADAAATRATGRPAPVRGPAPTGERRIDAGTERYLRAASGRGRTLPDPVRSAMERALGWSFADVRIHDDAEAARSARSLAARAYTHGRDIVFGSGHYAPHTNEGRRLLAHELTHVVQQGAASRVVQRSPSAGTARPKVENEWKPELAGVIVERDDAPDIQAEGEPAGAGEPAAPEAPVPAEGAGDEAVPAEEPAEPVAPAVPTLSLSPGTTLVRGAELTADVNFTPNAGEAVRVTGWSYTTTDHGTVDRAAASAAQRQWKGRMAVGGTLEAKYRITPAGGTEGAEQSLSADVTVSDRTGAPWASAVTEEPEGELAGKPSPPRQFSDLGLHRVPGATMPALTPETVADGPNTGMRFIASLTAGTYISRPQLHPDLRNATSAFKTFHNTGSRLFHVKPSGRTLIPATEYSNFSDTPSLSFDVPDWEVFYKARGMFRITCAAGDKQVVLRDSWWGLDPNAESGSVVIRNDAAIRTALEIDADTDYTTSIDTIGSFSGFAMMQAAAIVAGTQSHEYSHGTHSHRANFNKMMRALDPQRKIESRVQGIGDTVNFNTVMGDWWSEIIEPDHEIVDEAQSRSQEEFIATGDTMAGVNENPATGAFLGNVWNITGDQPMV